MKVQLVYICICGFLAIYLTIMQFVKAAQHYSAREQTYEQQVK